MDEPFRVVLRGLTRIVRLARPPSLLRFRSTKLLRLPEKVSAEQGACLGIPGITAHRAIHVPGPVSGRTVMVQGAAGSVGLCAVALARHAGARVIGTVRSSSDEATAMNAGAHDVFLSDNQVIARVRALAPEGIDHIVEVALAPMSNLMLNS